MQGVGNKMGDKIGILRNKILGPPPNYSCFESWDPFKESQ